MKEQKKEIAKMGMAAGQARLLSITARINHNELRAQEITNAKIRLSDATQAASDEYLKALSDTELQFLGYDAMGNQTRQPLTGNCLTYYGPLKNQYGLVNSAGQIMVSEIDGTNFKNSNTLNEFLDKYGLISPEYESNLERYKTDKEQYEKDKENYDNELKSYLDKLKGTLINFTEGDMRKLTLEEPTLREEPEVSPNPVEEPTLPDVPIRPTPPELIFTDSDQAQWYINLWHRMNGESDFKSGTEAKDDDGNLIDITQSKTNENYVILEDNLMNSPEWLEFALKNGVITLEQVQFDEPTETGTGLSHVAWTSLEYTSVGDISEQTNDIAITKAEVKYNNALKEIEAKDKRYDTDLKNLDTEHNALQTEYESIKGTISKNVERSFKAFS